MLWLPSLLPLHCWGLAAHSPAVRTASVTCSNFVSLSARPEKLEMLGMFYCTEYKQSILGGKLIKMANASYSQSSEQCLVLPVL